MARSRKSIGYTLLESDYEPRPNLRVVFRRKHIRTEGMRKITMTYARKVKQILDNNIRTGGLGRWARIQYGPKKGMMALQNTENQWTIALESTTKAVVRPKAGFRRIWRGHTRGKDKPIYPVKAKALTLHYPDGIVFSKRVRLPKRDPRPTESQLRSIV